MAEISQAENLTTLWEALGDDARTMVISFVLHNNISLNHSELYLIADASNSSLRKARKELTKVGVLEKVTLLKEAEERLEKMKPDDFYLKPVETVSPEKIDKLFAEDEQVHAYNKLLEEIEEVKKEPGIFPQYYSPRFRLTEQFYDFVAGKIR